MSGHSGFQPIGNNLPPIIPQPQVGDVRGPGQAPQSQPPAVSGGDVPARDYNVRKEAAEALSRKLDTMLFQAAKLSTRTVDNASLKSAMDAAHLGKADRKDLADAVRNKGDDPALAARQTRSLFFRDLFESLKRKGWFS